MEQQNGIEETAVDPSWKKRVLYFLLSQNISLFGSSVVSFAIYWHIVLETSSGLWMMFYTICALTPQVLISLFGGVWADRYNRKHIIMISDGFIALATLALAISFLLGFGRLELLLVASVIRSLGAGVQMPAVSAVFPQLVPREELTRVQGINQTLNSILFLVSPAAGGVVLGMLGIVGAFFVDVITAVLAIFVMAFIRIEKAPGSNDEAPVWKELKAGLVYTFGVKELRRIVICYLFISFLITPAAFLTTLLVQRNYGDDIWRLTMNEIVWTAGTILGGIFVSLKKQFSDKVRTVSICFIAQGIFLGLLGVSWNFASYLVIMGAAGLFMPVIVTNLTVYIQEITEPEVLGRVFSVVHFFMASAMPVAIIFFGPMADIVRIESLLLVSGALMAVVGFVYGRGDVTDSGKG